MRNVRWGILFSYLPAGPEWEGQAGPQILSDMREDSDSE